MHRTLALLLAAAGQALADAHCGTIQPDSKSAAYAPAVRAHAPSSAATAECPPQYYIGPKYNAWCCPEGDSINEVGAEAVACCPCGSDCGDFFPSAFDFSTTNGRIQFVPMTDDGSAKPTTLVTSASPDAVPTSSAAAAANAAALAQAAETLAPAADAASAAATIAAAAAVSVAAVSPAADASPVVPPAAVVSPAAVVVSPKVVPPAPEVSVAVVLSSATPSRSLIITPPTLVRATATAVVKNAKHPHVHPIFSPLQLFAAGGVH